VLDVVEFGDVGGGVAHGWFVPLGDSAVGSCSCGLRKHRHSGGIGSAGFDTPLRVRSAAEIHHIEQAFDVVALPRVGVGALAAWKRKALFGYVTSDSIPHLRE